MLPLTTPEEFTDALNVELLFQVPPAGVPFNVTVLPTQTVVGPVTVGDGFTVIVVVAEVADVGLAHTKPDVIVQ